MAALGMNTFFDGHDARTIAVNGNLENTDNIAAAKINGGLSSGMTSDGTIADPSAIPLAISALNNTFNFTENGVAKSVTLSNATYSSFTDLHTLAADIQTKMNAVSTLGPQTYRVQYDQSANQFTISENDGSKLKNLQVFWSQNPATATALGFKPLDSVYSPSTGDYGVSDNKNALAISNIQNTNYSIPQWNFTRGQDSYSKMASTTIGGSYQTMVSELGVTGSTLNNSVSTGTAIVNQLTQQRDSVSGVSIDEEMIKLISYQQTYTAASKLIKTVDDMLQALMAIR
jgi:flagellar hook-associated protein FlgK